MLILWPALLPVLLMRSVVNIATIDQTTAPRRTPPLLPPPPLTDRLIVAVLHTWAWPKRDDDDDVSCAMN